MEDNKEEIYLEVNKEMWNDKVDLHYESEFYDNESFLKGRNSLNEIELELVGDVSGKSLLHLQCHFGQDTISFSRMGAISTGVDFSDKGIEKAKKLAELNHVETRFIVSDVYKLPEVLDEKFDIVFTSYGTIGWLPDIDHWAKVVRHFLKPGGTFVFAEFHPFIWMYDDNFTEVIYNYFKDEPILEEESGSYADRQKDTRYKSITWNHSLGSVLNALIRNGLTIETVNEYDYSPYNCFSNMNEFSPGKFRINAFGNKIPLVYSIKAILNEIIKD